MLELIESKISNDPSAVLAKNNITTFLHPYSYLTIRDSKKRLDQFDFVMIDGGLLSFLLNKAGIKSKRYSFDMTSLAPIVFNYSLQNSKSIYFIGAKQEEITAAVEHITGKYPAINIVGYRNGYLSAEEQSYELKNIAKKNPDIVVVGMGVGRQEDFLIALKNTNLWKGAGFSCGGFFHQTAKRGVGYYPPIFNRLNLRWLYRMIDEPALIKRYFLYYPYFIVIFFYDVIKYKLKRK